jgi:hypothetical protein
MFKLDIDHLLVACFIVYNSLNTANHCFNVLFSYSVLFMYNGFIILLTCSISYVYYGFTER